MKTMILFISALILANLSFGQTLLTEGWESAANNSNVPPAGWGIDLISGPDITYYTAMGQFPTVAPFEGSRLVDFYSFIYVTGTNRLKRTTPISTMGYSNITVDFEWYTDPGYAGSTLEGVIVQWSTDGITWTNAGTTWMRWAPTAQWVLETQALPVGASNQPTLYVAFKFNAEYGNDCHMDLVHIKAGNPPLPAPLLLTATNTNVSCFGGSNGSIDLTVTGGTTPYNYLWSNGATTQDLNGLSPGIYSVTVTDALGQTATLSAFILQPFALTLSEYNNNVSCNGGSDGFIVLTVIGGTPPYSYLWSNGVRTKNLSNLFAGIYSVTVTDAHGCTSTAQATISQPEPLAVNTTLTQPILCNGGTGCIAADVTGGKAPYTYHWSDNSTGSSLCAHAGTYSVTVTDNNQCSANTSINLPQPASLYINAGENQLVYYGYPPAACTTLSWSGASGGVPPYTIQWSTGQTSQIITICPTVTTYYTVTIKDANNCTFSDQVKVCVADIRCGNGNNLGKKVYICHFPPGNPENAHTLCIDTSAVKAHLQMGDLLGPCDLDRTCTDSKSAVSISGDNTQITNDGNISLDAFPNPFSESVTITFTCTDEGNVSVKLIDHIGRQTALLFEKKVEKEVQYRVEVDGSKLSPGLYFCVLQHSDGTMKIKKLIYIK